MMEILDDIIEMKVKRETGNVLTVDEQTTSGGLGSIAAEVLMEGLGQTVKFKRIGLQNCFSGGCGPYQDLKRVNGIFVENIVEEASYLLGE